MKMKDYFKYKKEFGFRFASKYYINNILFKLTKIYKLKEKVHNQILGYLSDKYSNIISMDGCKIEPIEKDYNIWVFWWQGEEQMSQIVKACYNSIRNQTSHNVVLIDKNNFKDYVDIPDYILQKLDSKAITLTHFSDILRVCLLSKYGGMWADATIYMTGNIDKEIEGKNFYTNKNMTQENKKFASKGAWSGFFMAGNKNNPLFVNLRNLLFEYWKTHNFLVEYFLLDYFIKMICDSLEEVQQMIDGVENNNPNIYTLSKLMFNKYDKAKLDEICKDTSVFKLTWKFNPKLANKESTFYKNIIK